MGLLCHWQGQYLPTGYKKTASQSFSGLLHQDKVSAHDQSDDERPDPYELDVHNEQAPLTLPQLGYGPYEIRALRKLWPLSCQSDPTKVMDAVLMARR